MSTLPSNAQIRAIADPFYNGIIIQGIGSGVYTVLYFRAICRLHKEGKKIAYSAVLSILWMSVITDFFISWFETRAAFVLHNDSPQDLLQGIYADDSTWLIAPFIIAMFLSGSILVWRCNMLWQKKFILVALSTLVAATTAFNICQAMTRDSFGVLATALLNLFSFITNLSATSLIALRIGLATRQSPMRHSYSRIILILTESAAIVCVGALVLMILSLVAYVHPLHLATKSGRVQSAIFNYVNYLQTPIIGIGPTLISFRVAESRSQTTFNSSKRSAPLSGIRFQATAHDGETDTRHDEELTTGFNAGHTEGNGDSKAYSLQQHNEINAEKGTNTPSLSDY